MKPPTEIWRAAPHIRAGDLRPTDLIKACLDRLDRHEADLRAWVTVARHGALAAAKRLGAEAAAGRYLGPLHGVPIGIKDIIDVAGMPTRSGSELTGGEPTAEDAPVVAQLRAAGAVILGKTVTTEFAGFDPAVTRNPWSRWRTPGGSSSGSAVAVAAGMCLAAIGSQTGGSLTRPASYCGVASCKPTFGRIKMAGVTPVSRHLDHLGAIARCVADLVYIVDAMTPDGGVLDPFVAALRTREPPSLGILEDYFLEQATPPVALATRDALRQLEQAGATVAPQPLPEGFAEVRAMHRRIMATDAAALHQERFARCRDRYGQQMRTMLDEGLATAEATYQSALAHQRQFRTAAAAALQNVDVLVTPATPATATARRDGTGDPRFNVPWTYSGLPTVSFPSGLASDGLPVALQLVGRPHDEPRLLAVASWCERQLGLSLAPPILSENPPSEP